MRGFRLLAAGMCLLFLCTFASLCQAADQSADTAGNKTLAAAPDVRVDPQADALVKKMSDYLGSLKHLTLKAEASYESVLDNGQKLLFINEVDILLRRPDRMYAHRAGIIRNQDIYYNGTTLTLYSHGLNMWAQTAAPDTIHGMLDFAMDELGLNAPGGDLFYEDAYAGLMEEVEQGAYLGKVVVDGVTCHQVAFRGAEVDFQLWIQDGDRPIPRRYVITSKWVTSAPEYILRIIDWDDSTPIQEERFEFVPPKDSSRISFASEAGKKQDSAGQDGR